MLEVAPCRRRSLQKTTEVPDNRHATPSLEMQTSSHAASPNLTRLPPGRTRRHDAASTLESRPGRSLRKTGVLGNGNSRRPVLQYGDRTFLRIPREILTLVRAVDQAASSLVVLRNTVTKTDPVDAPSPAWSRTCHASRLRPGVARVRRHTQGAAREQHGLATDPDPKYASFRLPRASDFHELQNSTMRGTSGSRRMNPTYLIPVFNHSQSRRPDRQPRHHRYPLPRSDRRIAPPPIRCGCNNLIRPTIQDPWRGERH